MLLILLLFLALNLVTFCVFAWDKRCAIRGHWRVPERSLLTLALIGGSTGARLAQKMLRHKTTKQPFAGRLQLILIGHVALAIVLVILWAIG